MTFSALENSMEDEFDAIERKICPTDLSGMLFVCPGVEEPHFGFVYITGEILILNLIT